MPNSFNYAEWNFVMPPEGNTLNTVDRKLYATKILITYINF